MDDDRPWYNRPGWVASAALHAGVVALTFFSWPTSYVTPEPTEFVPVELLPIAETTNVAASSRADEPKEKPAPAAKPDPRPKPAPKPAPPKPEPKPEPPKPEPPKPEPEPAPPPEPKPAPKPEPKPAPEPKPEPAPAPPTPRAKPKEAKEPPKEVAEAKPEKKPEPEKKPDPKPEKKPEKKPDSKPAEKPADEEEDFDLDSVIAGLEDKEKKDDTSESAPEERKAEGTKPQRGAGDPNRATAAIQDAFKTQVSKCWDTAAFAGAPEAEKLVVALRIRLNRDGSLNGLPQYEDPGRLSDPYYRTAAEAGRRAVMQCQNYTLPADAYDQWSVLIVEFNPSQMIGL